MAGKGRLYEGNSYVGPGAETKNIREDLKKSQEYAEKTISQQGECAGEGLVWLVPSDDRFASVGSDNEDQETWRIG